MLIQNTNIQPLTRHPNGKYDEPYTPIGNTFRRARQVLKAKSLPNETRFGRGLSERVPVASTYGVFQSEYSSYRAVTNENTPDEAGRYISCQVFTYIYQYVRYSATKPHLNVVCAFFDRLKITICDVCLSALMRRCFVPHKRFYPRTIPTSRTLFLSSSVSFCFVFRDARSVQVDSEFDKSGICGESSPIAWKSNTIFHQG